MEPGNCWLFSGDKAGAVIRLAHEVAPTAFTIEHLPYSLLLRSAIDALSCSCSQSHISRKDLGSAPKDLTLLGILNGMNVVMQCSS